MMTSSINKVNKFDVTLVLNVIERSFKSYCSWPNVSILQPSVFVRGERCESLFIYTLFIYRILIYTDDDLIYD